jgi:hypothetical protein
MSLKKKHLKMLNLSFGMRIRSRHPVCLQMSPSRDPLNEQLFEGFSELSRHAAVDAEVQRVGEADAEVDGEDDRLDGRVVEEVVDGRRDCVQDRDDAQRKFN